MQKYRHGGARDEFYGSKEGVYSTSLSSECLDQYFLYHNHCEALVVGEGKRQKEFGIWEEQKNRLCMSEEDGRKFYGAIQNRCIAGNMV